MQRNPSAPLAYVGSEACAGCHRAKAALWHGSQHKRAMDHATEKSVLGDFSDATFDYHGVKSRFFRRDGKFLVETDGPDGKLATFEVKYTFGLDPLQQYLIEFPDGRLQALSIAWDSRPKDKGGQRWFHLYPNEEIRHDDILHWTKLNQNWNFMCAECHSTGVSKNYDAAKNTFATTWAEISVGCEACHGQGSRHVAWARGEIPTGGRSARETTPKALIVRLDERQGVAWPIDPRTGNAQRRVAPATVRKEVETCGLCHARRGTFSEDWVPGRWLSDTHVVSPLEPRPLSCRRADPRRRGVQLWLVQAEQDVRRRRHLQRLPRAAQREAARSGRWRLLAMPRGGQICASPPTAGMRAVNPPIGCPSCHMPARTYMVVDPRHDHSFRIPRPDISVKLGTPNACNDCHADKSAQWAADAIRKLARLGRKGFQHYAQLSTPHGPTGRRRGAAGRRRFGNAPRDSRAPARLRNSRLMLLAPHSVLAQCSLADPDPMVRIGALDMLENAPLEEFGRSRAPLLYDPVRGVRIRAADLLAGFRRPINRPPTAGFSTAQPPSLSLRRTQCRSSGSACRRSETFVRDAAKPRKPRPNTGQR